MVQPNEYQLMNRELNNGGGRSCKHKELVEVMWARNSLCALGDTAIYGKRGRISKHLSDANSANRQLTTSVHISGTY